MKTKITLDVSPAVNGKAGLGRYAATLAEELAKLHPEQVKLFANRIRTAKVPPELRDMPLRAVDAGYKFWRMAVFAGQILRIPFDRVLHPETEVYHATEHLLLPVRKKKTVMTIHDLIYKLLPEHHKKLNYWYLNTAMPLFVRRADHVITVSEATKRDLMREYGTPAEKITVVYEAAAPHFTAQTPEKIAEVRQRYNLPEQYITAVGTIEPRKNLARVVEALAVLRKDHPDLHFVVVGADGWLTESFYEAISTTGLEDAVIRPGYIPDADLPAVYAGAELTILASFYEGFGLPVLEGMACGSPVACSATSSVGEIAGDAALTFDPESTAEIIKAVQSIITDDALRSDLIARGLKRAAEFSWERAAQETAAVYEKLINQSQ